MTTVSSRRFGTEISNIPVDILHKTPTKKMTQKSQVYTPKVNSSNPFVTPVAASKNQSLFDVTENLMGTFKIPIDDEITISSPVKSLPVDDVDDFRYNREYLLSFREFCKEPIEGLIPEVLPGFSHPEPIMELLTPTKPKPMPKQFSSPMSVASPFQATVNSPKDKQKKVKKQKPREQDPRRLSARQKQIDIGMNTPGYIKFNETVPLNARTKEHPKTPDIYQVCSKRSWDGQVRKWRRQLHDFDPSPAGQDGFNQDAADLEDTEASSEDECSLDDGEEQVNQ